MPSFDELRSKLRAIRKRLAKNIGYEDFKYLHEMTRPQLEALIKKYENFEKNTVGTIQNAIRNKRAKNEALSRLEKRDTQQNIRDLEARLAYTPNIPLIVSDIASSIKRKKSNIRDLYEPALTPFSTFELFSAPVPQNQLFTRRNLPLPNVRVNTRPASASTLNRPTVSSLSRVDTRPRPESAGRTYNKYKPI
jgi:hypothetical protein